MLKKRSISRKTHVYGRCCIGGRRLGNFGAVTQGNEVGRVRGGVGIGGWSFDPSVARIRVCSGFNDSGCAVCASGGS